METIPLLLCVVIALTLAFDYTNGFHDTANSIATAVSTRAMKPRTAVLYAGTLNFVGAMMGTEVAATIGKGLVNAAAISLHTVFCTIVSAILWNVLTWYKGLPTSSSHAVIGSLLGATYFSAGGGRDDIMWGALLDKVVLPMAAAPVLGVAGGFVTMVALTWAIYRLHPSFIRRAFSRLQVVSAGFMALSHGRNDAQKSMGIIALALMLAFPGRAFEVPLWVKMACALAMGAGTMSGGWRIIRTLGSKMIKLDPPQGFAAEMTSAAVIGGASHFGVPLSTTHVITASIMGVGATQGLSAVRWGVVGDIVTAWVLTIPLTFLFSGGLMTLYKLVVF